MTRDDRGSASIWLLAIGFVVVTVGIGATLVGAAVTDRHRAQVAADLGALAGARYAVDGAGTACERADRIVAANGARLVDCRLDGLDLIVTAQAGPARAAARAGPVAVAAPQSRYNPHVWLTLALGAVALTLAALRGADPGRAAILGLGTQRDCSLTMGSSWSGTKAGSPPHPGRRTRPGRSCAAL